MQKRENNTFLFASTNEYESQWFYLRSQNDASQHFSFLTLGFAFNPNAFDERRFSFSFSWFFFTMKIKIEIWRRRKIWWKKNKRS